MLGHLGTDKPRQWTDLFPEWQPPPSPHVSLLSSSRTLLLLRVQGCERACDLREAAWQLRIFSAGAQSLKERRIETEGGKVQGGDTACLRSFLLKRSYNFLFEGWLSVQESPAEEERQGRIRWGGGRLHPTFWPDGWEESRACGAPAQGVGSCPASQGPAFLFPPSLPLSCQGHLDESPRAAEVALKSPSRRGSGGVSWKAWGSGDWGER